MTYTEAVDIARAVRDSLPWKMRQQLKAVDVAPKLHQGMLTIRVYCLNQAAEDPPPFIFKAEELS